MMKKVLFTLLVLFSLAPTIALAQMTDQQVLSFIAKETKAGTSQGQIVTKLVQRGVKIDQIRRLRQQYAGQVSRAGMDSQADNSLDDIVDRLRTKSRVSDSRQSTTENEDVTNEFLQQPNQFSMQPEDNLLNDNSQQSIYDMAENKIIEDSLKVFGRDIFNNKLLSFEPNMNISTPQNYVLGPGDEVIVDVYGASQKSGKFTVSPEGNIVIPGYGPIYLGGLTVAGAQQKLRATLGSRYKSSQLSTTVGNTRSMMINVMGEVKAPGTYTLSAFSTVFHALYMAGGINDLGTLRNIKVYRNGRQITVVDVYQYILNGRLAGNIRLQDNDMIIVGPYDCLVGIHGKVKRPMFYEMRPSESVAQILQYAGGFTADAYKKTVRLTRKSGDRYSAHTVDEFDMSSFKLADGDMISIDAMIDRFENMVEVRGAVFRPGQYELGKQISTVRALIETAGGLMEDAFITRGVLHRMKADRTLETQSLDLAGIMSGSVADVPLRNEDVLFIGTQAERTVEQTFTIAGEVLKPGTYQYSDHTTIEDLIVMAGGLRDQASLAKVSVSRRILDPLSTQKSDVISKSFSFDLKDGLVITGGERFFLEPYDVVTIYRSPAFSSARNITVSGEVNFEGNVTLESKKMRLSDAIRMAGGITDAAYLRGARLVRVMNNEERVRAQSTLKALQNILSERGDSINMVTLAAADSTYLVGINLEEAIKNPGSDKDILLREGDVLSVPEYNPVVKISGDVLYPNNVFFETGKNYKYYVRQAGGFGNRAKKSKTFIVYQNGTVDLVKNGAKPEPGCEIIVPSKKRKEPFNLAGMIGIGSSLASLATMIVALTKL